MMSQTTVGDLLDVAQRCIDAIKFIYAEDNIKQEMALIKDKLNALNKLNLKIEETQPKLNNLIEKQKQVAEQLNKPEQIKDETFVPAPSTAEKIEKYAYNLIKKPIPTQRSKLEKENNDLLNEIKQVSEKLETWQTLYKNTYPTLKAVENIEFSAVDNPFNILANRIASLPYQLYMDNISKEDIARSHIIENPIIIKFKTAYDDLEIFLVEQARCYKEYPRLDLFNFKELVDKVRTEKELTNLVTRLQIVNSMNLTIENKILGFNAYAFTIIKPKQTTLETSPTVNVEPVHILPGTPSSLHNNFSPINNLRRQSSPMITQSSRNRDNANKNYVHDYSLEQKNPFVEDEVKLINNFIIQLSQSLTLLETTEAKIKRLETENISLQEKGISNQSTEALQNKLKNNNIFLSTADEELRELINSSILLLKDFIDDLNSFENDEKKVLYNAFNEAFSALLNQRIPIEKASLKKLTIFITTIRPEMLKISDSLKWSIEQRDLERERQRRLTIEAEAERLLNLEKEAKETQESLDNFAKYALLLREKMTTFINNAEAKETDNELKLLFESIISILAHIQQESVQKAIGQNFAKWKKNLLTNDARLLQSKLNALKSEIIGFNRLYSPGTPQKPIQNNRGSLPPISPIVLADQKAPSPTHTPGINNIIEVPASIPDLHISWFQKYRSRILWTSLAILFTATLATVAVLLWPAAILGAGVLMYSTLVGGSALCFPFGGYKYGAYKDELRYTSLLMAHEKQLKNTIQQEVVTYQYEPKTPQGKNSSGFILGGLPQSLTREKLNEQYHLCYKFDVTKRIIKETVQKGSATIAENLIPPIESNEDPANVNQYRK